MTTMNKYRTAAALAVLIPCALTAQVEKRVEVTKAYEPRVTAAEKLPVAPDMTDTTQLRPEIDYTVTPLTLDTSPELRSIRPAQVTYWEFNRPSPGYLKAGAGYPLNSVFDLYAATQHASTGYLLGYLNHAGRYADLRNDAGEQLNAVRMLNRAGAAAGKYVGRHTLEAGLSYEHRLDHRCGALPANRLIPSPEPQPAAASPRIGYGELAAEVRFGDDFRTFDRTQFEVEARGLFFADHSRLAEGEEASRQADFGFGGRVGHRFGRHTLQAALHGDLRRGKKALDGWRQTLWQAEVRYAREWDQLHLEAGLTYVHDRHRLGDAADTRRQEDYLFPYLRLDYDLGSDRLHPYLEIDGGVHDNSFRALTRECPYVAPATAGAYSPADYNGRLGIRGSLGRERVNYRLYAAFSIRDHHIYWCPLLRQAERGGLMLLPVQARQTVGSLHGEAEIRAASTLRINLGAHACLYNDESDLENGEPVFRADIGLRYTGRKVSLGLGTSLQSPRRWSVIDLRGTEAAAGDGATTPALETPQPFKAPFFVDLQIFADWKISGKTTLFAEGGNLLDRPACRYPGYPEYGAHFTAGIKLAF